MPPKLLINIHETLIQGNFIIVKTERHAFKQSNFELNETSPFSCLKGLNIVACEFLKLTR